MLEENHKKWLIIAIIIAATCFLGFKLWPVISGKPNSSQTTGSQNPTTSSNQLKIPDNSIVLPLEDLGVDTGDKEALYRLANQHFDRSNHKQAIVIYKRILELNPAETEAYNDLGLSYFYTNNPDLALKTLRKGIVSNEFHQRIRLSYGFVLMAAGKNQEAKVALQKASDMNPNSSIGQEASRLLGKIL